MHNRRKKHTYPLEQIIAEGYLRLDANGDGLRARGEKIVAIRGVQVAQHALGGQGQKDGGSHGCELSGIHFGGKAREGSRARAVGARQNSSRRLATDEHLGAVHAQRGDLGGAAGKVHRGGDVAAQGRGARHRQEQTQANTQRGRKHESEKKKKEQDEDTSMSKNTKAQLDRCATLP